ncbi:hypothetical protein, partial [Agrococcus casei]
MTLLRGAIGCWVLLCTFGYTLFGSLVIGASPSASAVSLPQAMSDLHLTLFGMVPAWVILLGAEADAGADDQRLVRFGSRSRALMAESPRLVLTGLCLALLMTAGAAAGLAVATGRVTADLLELGYVTMTQTFAFAAVAMIMRLAALLVVARVRADVWAGIGLWFVSVVMILGVSEAAWWSPVGIIVAKFTDDGPDLSAPGVSTCIGAVV